MITIDDYVGIHKNSIDWNENRKANAIKFLVIVNKLIDEMTKAGIVFHINPNTKTTVSGQTFGGFRPQNCPQGAANSSHKEGRAVDIYDPNGQIDEWLMNNQDKLIEFNLYIEHPSKTSGWSHWSDKSPKSGNHVFYP